MIRVTVFLVVLILVCGCLGEVGEASSSMTSTTLVGLHDSLVDAAVEARNLSVCDEGFDFENYSIVVSNPSSCIKKTLDEFNDVYDCLTFPQVQKRLCVHHLAVKLGDSNVCITFKNPVHKNSCVEYVRDYSQG